MDWCCCNVSFFPLILAVRQTDQAVRGLADVISCLLCTGVQGGTFWLPPRTNTSTS